MNEKLLFAALTEPLTDLLTQIGVSDLPFIKGNQSTTQGRLERAAYVTRIDRPQRGWQKHDTRQGSTTMDQMMQDTYQVQVSNPNDPANAAQLTANDLAERLRMLVQSPQYVAALRAQGIGLQIPTAIRPLVFRNESEQFEDHPTFDFTVSYKSSIILTTPEVDVIDPDIHRI
jgi:hypothetical protein